MKRENNESSIFGLCFVLTLIVLFEFRNFRGRTLFNRNNRGHMRNAYAQREIAAFF